MKLDTSLLLHMTITVSFLSVAANVLTRIKKRFGIGELQIRLAIIS